MKRILFVTVLAVAACSHAPQKTPGTPAAAPGAINPSEITPPPAATLGALAIDSAIVRPPVGGRPPASGL